MNNDDTNLEEYLGLARRLVAQLESKDGAAALQTIDSLTRIRETELFRELGSLTRDLHDALKSFQVDSRLCAIANDIPDARERLSHVINLTEQAAHRTLTAIESALPLAEDLGTRARSLAEQWQRFLRRELCVEEFRDLSREVDGFLASVQTHGSQLQASLSDALMAQDYQDLTGQIIRRVIALVQEVEDGLVKLVRISGQRISAQPSADKDDEAAERIQDSDRRGHGPAIPGQSDDVVQGQDDVDDLLSSLGF